MFEYLKKCAQLIMHSLFMNSYKINQYQIAIEAISTSILSRKILINLDFLKNYSEVFTKLQ